MRRAILLAGRKFAASGSRARAFATIMSAAASIEAIEPRLVPWSDIGLRFSGLASCSELRTRFVLIRRRVSRCFAGV